MKPWLRPTASGFTLTLHIQPGAKQTGLAGEHGDALKIRLAAPPVDGKANTALQVYLAGFFGIPRQQVTLLSGQTSRRKVLAIAGIPAEVAVQKLLP